MTDQPTVEQVQRILDDLGLNPLAEVRPESLDLWWEGYLTALQDVRDRLAAGA